jgi:predicted lipid-binding transport protein (Tim44 family)
MPETLMMVRTAVVLLALTAGGGLVIAALRFAHRPRPPHWLAMLHGLMAGAALTLLLYAAFTTGLPGGAWAGLAVLLLATLGGLVLNLRYHVHDQPLPIWLVLAHGAIAAVGLVLIALAAW